MASKRCPRNVYTELTRIASEAEVQKAEDKKDYVLIQIVQLDQEALNCPGKKVDDTGMRISRQSVLESVKLPSDSEKLKSLFEVYKKNHGPPGPRRPFYRAPWNRKTRRFLGPRPVYRNPHFETYKYSATK